MKLFLLKRVALIFPTILGSATLIFLMLALAPGDPARMILGQHASREALIQVRSQLGLDQPLYRRYLSFMGGLFRGNFGKSLQTKRPVVDEVLAYFPATVELAMAALIWSSLLGMLLGVLAATNKNSLFDYSSMSVALVGVSMPIFWLGLLLILVFSVKLGWLPSGGRMNVRLFFQPITGLFVLDGLLLWLRDGDARYFSSAIRHLILPAIALGTIPLAITARITRSSMLESLQKPYLRTARALGLAQHSITYRYALRNALLPVVTVVGLQFGTLLSGAVLTETIFSWPGLGKWLYIAIQNRDYPAIQGGVILISIFFLLINLAVDILYTIINPRIRVN